MRPRVVAGVGHGVAAGVPKHVGVNRKGEAGALADALDEPGHAGRVVKLAKSSLASPAQLLAAGPAAVTTLI
jgi:hypothetical protein